MRLHLKCIIVKIHCDMHVKMETVRCAVTADCFGGRRRKVSSIINNVLPSSFCPSPSSPPLPSAADSSVCQAVCSCVCVHIVYLPVNEHTFISEYQYIHKYYRNPVLSEYSMKSDVTS